MQRHFFVGGRPPSRNSEIREWVVNRSSFACIGVSRGSEGEGPEASPGRAPPCLNAFATQIQPLELCNVKWIHRKNANLA